MIIRIIFIAKWILAVRRNDNDWHWYMQGVGFIDDPDLLTSHHLLYY